jgi:hypothetical protein
MSDQVSHPYKTTGNIFSCLLTDTGSPKHMFVCVFKYVWMCVNWCFLSSRMLQGSFIHIMHQHAGFVFCPVFVYSIPTSADIPAYLAVH